VAAHAAEKHLESHRDSTNEAWRLKRKLTDPAPCGKSTIVVVIIVGFKGGTIMIQQTLQADLFKQRLGDSLQRETLNTRAVKIVRHTNVYT
jgi:hypothetical protein